MNDVVSTYAQLTKALDNLPPPPANHVRVYRGQNLDYRKMMPTALRGSLRHSRLWNIHSWQVAQVLESTMERTGESEGELTLVRVWLHAIKQHYGPGTAFLDVTHSPGIAAWFALHRAVTQRERTFYGDEGPFDPERDVVADHDFIRFVRYMEEPAYLYVFDVRLATALSELKHGELVDLATAPALFSGGRRIQVQKACLIYSDDATSSGDLSGCYVDDTPFRIRWPLTGCPEVGLLTNELFPPASDDDWYARFVSVPLAPSLTRTGNVTVFDHAIRTSLYIPEGHDERANAMLFDDLKDRITCWVPRLLWSHLIRVGGQGLRAQNPIWEQLQEATPLILEGPLLAALPPVGSEAFNIGLLPYDLTDSAPTWDLESGELTGHTSLRNVFVEMSPLEYASWVQAESASGSGRAFRGVWLIRDGADFTVTVHLVHFPLPSRPTILGPARVTFKEEDSVFLVTHPSRPDFVRPLLEVPDFGVPFLKALALVRSLSPGWKVGHAAHLSTDPKVGFRSKIRIEWSLGELLSLGPLSGPIGRYYAIREMNSNEPYFGGIPTSSGPVGHESLIIDESFSSISPGVLRDWAAPVIARLPVPRPVSGEPNVLRSQFDSSAVYLP